MFVRKLETKDKYVTTLRVVWIEILSEVNTYLIISVTTLRVVWIEIAQEMTGNQKSLVTTLRVVWIEIITVCTGRTLIESPPCGWCGLKFLE